MTGIIPVVGQFGFTPASGSLPAIVDGNELVGWAPAADPFSSYTAPFINVTGTPNFGHSFPALEFDFGTAIRLPIFRLKLEAISTLGPAMLIGSDNPASSAADTVQAGDELMGIYTQAQLFSGLILTTAALTVDIRKRYYRLCQHGVGVVITQPPLPPDGGETSKVTTFDSGAGNFTVIDYSTTLIIELWGGGAAGGESALSTNGTDTTVSTYSLTASGGVKPSATTANSGSGAGTGGAATGGNTLNIAGGNGTTPSPTSVGAGLSGSGGDAPYGGAGAAGTPNTGFGMVSGNAGTAPGGGGSGRNVFSAVAGGSYFKYPGGGSGGYVKHVFTKGVGSPPAAGALIAYSIGAGGFSGDSVANGPGAAGRVKFSWD